jgi:hypothetical protein
MAFADLKNAFVFRRVLATHLDSLCGLLNDLLDDRVQPLIGHAHARGGLEDVNPEEDLLVIELHPPLPLLLKRGGEIAGEGIREQPCQGVRVCSSTLSTEAPWSMIGAGMAESVRGRSRAA